MVTGFFDAVAPGASTRLEEVARTAQSALERVAKDLPSRFPAIIHDAVSQAVLARVRHLEVAT